ncbi:LADA_0E11496g1_1 [Lachancea dasiensis]|uniref:LADA_0E11496g1_1 n=1 Tax=Lachancea dasiensis TaxID=1072105 RepID=A0A1G4JER9_9SACH|nr:LADA_0E11496g1_1 [Lachancea dasiensis]
MNLYAYFVVLFVVFAFILVLPLLSGTFSYKLHKPTSHNSHTSQESASSISRRQKLREKLNITKEQNPLRIHLDAAASSSIPSRKYGIDSKTGPKRRTIAKFDNDPNTYDYDLAELIGEDEREEQRERELQFRQFAGKQQEVHESLV